MNKVIEQMVRAVRDGYTPRSVYETSLTFHPGSTVRVNKDTKGQLYGGGGDVDVPKGSVVSIVGVGAGPTGKDHLVMLPDGRKATIAFYDLGESYLRRSKSRVREDEPADAEANGDDKPAGEGDDDDTDENGDDDDTDENGDDDDRIVRVSLAKPLSTEAEDWLKSGYREAGVDLPDMPEDDQPDSMTFLMKAKGQEGLGKAIGELKKVAGESMQKIEPASQEDWDKA